MRPEIEEVIASHPAVAEVAVASLPHRQKEEVAEAWVVLRNGVGASEEDIRAYCRERLAPYKVPARVELIRTLPNAATGKVQWRLLVASAGAEHEVTAPNSAADGP